MISTISVFLILFLLVILGLGIFAFYIFSNQRKGLLTMRYTRGANATIPKNKDSVDVKMKCDSGKEICVYRATQICTSVSPGELGGYEASPLDSMSDGGPSGGGAAYGDFNPDTTIDLTKKMGAECNGKGECTFKFTRDWNSVKGECSLGDGQDATTQLIATYTCYPPGSTKNGTCNSWSPGSTPLQQSIYPGCTECSSSSGKMDAFCPGGTLPESAPVKSGAKIPAGTPQKIRNYKTQYDSDTPSYTKNGINWWWASNASKC